MPGHGKGNGCGREQEHGKGNGCGREQEHGKNCKCCSLREVGSGKKVKIRCHHSKGAVRQRLLDLGFVPQTDIEVIRRAPLGDPIECRVANYKVALRKSEACLIEVEQY